MGCSHFSPPALPKPWSASPPLCLYDCSKQIPCFTCRAPRNGSQNSGSAKPDPVASLSKAGAFPLLYNQKPHSLSDLSGPDRSHISDLLIYNSPCFSPSGHRLSVIFLRLKTLGFRLCELMLWLARTALPIDAHMFNTTAGSMSVHMQLSQ